ncbi:hypothetical protein J4H92_13880 [Leucobacter weissii]|uniref:4'-phosphopantetheinyl transferase n=1 Tax=Leucobacter weissii TaxID=1983706 RepID=A0A939MM09_9MICO|nr:hypothetical protein [Leucobacter weissii]MBO1903031.1 hypothetical protein [Leucobacter weissii]
MTDEMRMRGVRLAWGEAADGEDRRALGRRLLRGIVARGADILSVCPRCGGPHGRPLVRIDGAPGPLVSIAYSGATVLVGVAPPGATAFGIDLELDTGARRRAVLEAIGSRELVDWTRLEAIAKARGTGLQGAPAPPEVELAADGWILPQPEAQRPGSQQPGSQPRGAQPREAQPRGARRPGARPLAQGSLRGFDLVLALTPTPAVLSVALDVPPRVEGQVVDDGVR